VKGATFALVELGAATALGREPQKID